MESLKRGRLISDMMGSSGAVVAYIGDLHRLNMELVRAESDDDYAIMKLIRAKAGIQCPIDSILQKQNNSSVTLIYYAQELLEVALRFQKL